MSNCAASTSYQIKNLVMICNARKDAPDTDFAFVNPAEALRRASFGNKFLHKGWCYNTND